MSKSSEQPAKAGRAIITFSRGWQTLVATRSLGRRGVEVVTGDEYAMTASSFSKYSVAEFRYPNPDKEPEKFLDVLEKTVPGKNIIQYHSHSLSGAECIFAEFPAKPCPEPYS